MSPHHRRHPHSSDVTCAPQNGRRVIAKLEERLRSLESELDHEQRRHSDVTKNLRKADRRIKELVFQVRTGWWYRGTGFRCLGIVVLYVPVVQLHEITILDLNVASREGWEMVLLL